MGLLDDAKENIVDGVEKAKDAASGLGDFVKDKAEDVETFVKDKLDGDEDGTPAS